MDHLKSQSKLRGFAHYACVSSRNRRVPTQSSGSSKRWSKDQTLHRADVFASRSFGAVKVVKEDVFNGFVLLATGVPRVRLGEVTPFQGMCSPVKASPVVRLKVTREDVSHSDARHSPITSHHSTASGPWGRRLDIGLGKGGWSRMGHW